MEARSSDRNLFLLLGAALLCAVLGCVVVVLIVGRNSAALRSGACKPAASQDQLGRLLFKIPRVPGADEPWDFPPHLLETPADDSPAHAAPTGPPTVDDAPAGQNPQTKQP